MPSIVEDVTEVTVAGVVSIIIVEPELIVIAGKVIFALSVPESCIVPALNITAVASSPIESSPAPTI